MKQTVLLCSIVLLLAVVPANAQVSDETVLTYEVLTEDYDELVQSAMDLDEEQWAAFEPVFVAYKEAMHPVFDRRIKVIKEYVKRGGQLTDEEAAMALELLSDIERDEWLVLRDFERDFLEVIPAARVLRFLQIENRMMMVLMSTLAKDIPLAKEGS